MTRHPAPRSPRETILGMLYLGEPGDSDAPLLISPYSPENGPARPDYRETKENAPEGPFRSPQGYCDANSEGGLQCHHKEVP